MRSFPAHAAATLLALSACGGVETDAIVESTDALAGSFSGVDFDEAQAFAVVDMLDKATYDELDAVPLVIRGPAEGIIAARPFHSRPDGEHPLARLDKISGVGPAMLRSFRDNVERLWCSKGDGRQMCRTFAPSAPAGVVINEFSTGASGWVELFNGSTGVISLAGWTIDDDGAAAPKKLSAPLALNAGKRIVVTYAGINSGSADGVTVRDASGKVVDKAPNAYDGATLSGSCLARIPDGGAFTGQRETCSMNLPNSSATPGPTPTPGACVATGGTYDAVKFTKAEECKAVDFLNRARVSQMGALTDRGRTVAVECEPSGNTVVCSGYRTAKWTTLVPYAGASNIATTSMQGLKDALAGWVDDGGLNYDTVAQVYANRQALAGNWVAFDRVYVTKIVSNTTYNGCVEFRDAPTARNYLVACAQFVNADSAPACSSAACATELAGGWWQIRGVLAADSRWGFKVNLRHDNPRPGNPALAGATP